ncbi:MAG: BON domain-containing protein [Tepidisphaeraceae bacterium]
MKSALLFAAVCGIGLAGCQQNSADSSQSPGNNPPAYNSAGPSDEYSGSNSNSTLNQYAKPNQNGSNISNSAVTPSTPPTPSNSTYNNPNYNNSNLPSNSSNSDNPGSSAYPSNSANSSLNGNSTNQPDNTGVNTRDRSADSVTAQTQGESQSDINLTSQIRQRILGGNMSVDAQNVKVITLNGHVTLRGPVNTQDEKDTIGKMASDIAGQTNVDNQIEVKPQ